MNHNLSIIFSFIIISSVGGKDQGTRFLTYTDAIAGFRHLLTQADLDRALSLCTSQRGHLRSRYLVLSDDRVLPPYQGSRPKSVNPQQPQPGQQSHASQFIPSQASTAHQPQPDISRPPPQFQQILTNLALSSVAGGLVPVQLPHVAAPLSSVPFPGVSGVIPVRMPLIDAAPVQTPLLGAIQTLSMPVQQTTNPPQAQQMTEAIPPAQTSLPPAANINTSLPFLAVKKKRKRKTPASTQETSKRSTPMRKAKAEKSGGVPQVAANEHEFLSCTSASGSDEEMVSEVVQILGN